MSHKILPLEILFYFFVVFLWSMIFIFPFSYNCRDTSQSWRPSLPCRVGHYMPFIIFLFQRCCYILYWVPVKFLCWNSNPQCHGILRWGLWEIIWFRWSDEGRALMTGLVPLKEEKSQSLLSLSAKWGHRKKAGLQACLQAQNRILTRTWPHWNSNIGLSTSRTVRT